MIASDKGPLCLVFAALILITTFAAAFSLPQGADMFYPAGPSGVKTAGFPFFAQAVQAVLPAETRAQKDFSGAREGRGDFPVSNIGAGGLIRDTQSLCGLFLHYESHSFSAARTPIIWKHRKDGEK